LGPVVIEDIPVTGFADASALFTHAVVLMDQPGQKLMTYVNVHVANTAWHNPRLKKILQQADIVYPDGAGIVWASKLLGAPLPCRLEAAGWVFDFVSFMAAHQKTVYFIAGEPGVAQKALTIIEKRFPHHTIIGIHHGFILKDPALRQQGSVGIYCPGGEIGPPHTISFGRNRPTLSGR